MFDFIKSDQKVSFFLISIALLGAAWYITGKKPEEITQKDARKPSIIEKRITQKNDTSKNILDEIFSQTIETLYFSFSSPSGWWVENEIKEKGLARGVLTNGNTRLEYAYGPQDTPFLLGGDSAHMAVDDVIGDYPARVVYPKNSNGYLTYIYFENTEKENDLILQGEYLTAEERKITFQIFKSMKLK
jgi:hypothetical protein